MESMRPRETRAPASGHGFAQGAAEGAGQGRGGEAQHQHAQADQEKGEEGADVAEIGQLVDGGQRAHQGHGHRRR